MSIQARPYLVLPQLIPQPTWGGEYITTFKNWRNKFGLEDLKIGQSYELYGKSKLALEITDTNNPKFVPLIDTAELTVNTKTIDINDLIHENPEFVLGASVMKRFGDKMPLLVKFTQALGNSFQLHKRGDNPDPSWKPKPESWYFLEPGNLTYGLTPGCDVPGYKACCMRINDFMKSVSKKVREEGLPLSEAKIQANVFIKNENPWQYVNVHQVDAGALIDLSIGALHHSWEEDSRNENGNIVYEIQQDVTDAESTLRSFDQGKFKDDGSIRDLTIDQYFDFIDTDPVHNDLQFAKRKRKGDTLLSTPYYALDEYLVKEKRDCKTDGSFAHIFVSTGACEVICTGGNVLLTKGHSCFIPDGAKSFSIVSVRGPVTVLKTYIAQ